MKTIFNVGVWILFMLTTPTVHAQLKQTPRSKFYDNYKQISFIPLQLIGNIRNEVDLTVGLRYEQTLIPHEISFSAPLTHSMVSNMTYFSPGLKVFFRNEKNARLFMTPQLYTAFGRGEWATYRWVDGIQITEFKNGMRYKVGFLMNVGADFNLSDRWQLGVDYGWGLTYFDRYPTLRNPWDEPHKVRTLFQLSCGLGYKF